MAVLAPLSGQLGYAIAHFDGHSDCARRRVRTRYRIVEQHQESVANEPFDCTLVLMNNRTKIGVILTQNRHDFLGFGGFSKRREPAQIAKDDGDVAAMAVEQTFVAFVENKLCYLRCQETP